MHQAGQPSHMKASDRADQAEQADMCTRCCHGAVKGFAYNAKRMKEKEEYCRMKNKMMSALIYLVIDFVVALIVSIAMGRFFHQEQLIDWMTIPVIIVVLMILNARAIGCTADAIGKDGFAAALRTLFVAEKK